MRVRISIAMPEDWHDVVVEVPEGSDQECYALPRGADRFEFWERKSGGLLPRGKAMIWETIDD